jgi:hypothetical protein
MDNFQYSLTPINNKKNEWAVTVTGESLPCGTIRKLSFQTYGWHDGTGLHEYRSLHIAAVQCIRRSPERKERGCKNWQAKRRFLLRSA